MKRVVLILLIAFSLGGCNGQINTAYEVFDDCQRWTAEEMNVSFDYCSKYLEYENAQTFCIGHICSKNEEVLFCVSCDSHSNMFFYNLESEQKLDEIVSFSFEKAPDEYTYVVKTFSSKIPDIIPNGTILTFKREDITEDELFMPEELGGLKQEVITRSTADEMDIFFDTHPKYRNYENSSTDMVGCIHTESENVYFCAEYNHRPEYALYFYSLDKTNTELAIGRRITADHRSYQVEIECSQIPDILPDGTILTFRRKDIPVDEMFMPEELGELKQENANGAQG